MIERKVEIIDKTLVVLDILYGESIRKKIPVVRTLIKLIHEIGSDYIEIPYGLYNELSPLPTDIRIKISNNLDEEIDMYSVIYNKLLNKSSKNLRIVISDNMIFNDYHEIFMKIIKNYSNEVEMCIKNENSSATAMSLEWIRAGGIYVVTTFAGIGGYTSLESILCSLEFLENMKPRGNSVLFPKMLKIFEEITEKEINPNMPFIGKDIFNVESGIHVNGIAKNPKTYEPYDPSKIGRERKIIIGKHSGVSALEIKLKELNIKYNHNKLKIMLDDVRKVSMQKHRGLNNEEIKEIYYKCCI